MADQIGEPDQQADVVAFLETAGALQPGEPARRIDTHAALVFLAGDRAWKLKRAVHFGYLDFSSIEKRRAALETELILNRRTAPTLYLAVRPICRDGRGALNLEGRGGPVDWLLEMKRFPDGALLEDVAARGELTGAMIMQLADQICAFHADAEQVQLPPGRDRIGAVIAGNRASMAAFPAILPPEATNGVIERQIGEVVRHAALLDVRAAQGRVRHAHGDLHLANIAVIPSTEIGRSMTRRFMSLRTAVSARQ